MRIYHVEFAKEGTDLSGGEICMLEQIKYFKSKKINNILLTTDNGREVYEKAGLTEDTYLEYKTIKYGWSEKKYHIFISYVLRTFGAIKLVRKITPQSDDILFCHSDFFPNSIPFYFLAKKNTNTKLFYWFHMLAPNVLKGYEGHFTGRFQLPKLNIIHYRMCQLLYKRLSFSRGVIITVNSYYKEILRKQYKKNEIYVIKRFGGVDTISTEQESKKYDLVWMGRIHSQKGFLEIPAILELLKKGNKEIKIVIIGDGDKKIKDLFWNSIKGKGLDDCVEDKGFIIGEEKLKYLRQSKIFLMTSYYESFGLVNLEAMKCGLPVVAYNLPVFDIFKNGMVKVGILNNDKMAEEIMKLLSNKQYYEKTSKEALNFSKSFSWDKTGKEIYNLITAKP